MSVMMSPRKVSVVVCLISLFSLVLAGCSPSGPPRYNLSGKIEFDGKPIPSGRIIFEPDRSAGNEGIRAVADIKDGHYQMPPGEGTIGGPHDVKIFGGDGTEVGGTPYGNSLFPMYRTKIDVPKEQATYDFNVPATRDR